MACGKFEGEPPWVEYYYEQWGNGDGENYFPDDFFENDDRDLTDYSTLFEVDYDESVTHGLVHGDWVAIWEDSQGFVHSRTGNKEHVISEFLGWLGR